MPPTNPFYKDPRGVYRLKEFDRLAWLDHGFGTRLSGNWVPGPLVTLRQIHSDRCVPVDGNPGPAREGDALISNRVGIYLGVRTADCLPILVVDERVRAVAAVHAGWRGTASDIAAKTVEAMRARFASRPEDLLIAIGPGICGKCYTVGAEVAVRFGEWFPERADLDRQATLDLAEANRRQLIAAGADSARILCGAPCTACSTAEFHSYRRDRARAGRMVSAVGIRRSQGA